MIFARCGEMPLRNLHKITQSSLMPFELISFKGLSVLWAVSSLLFCVLQLGHPSQNGGSINSCSSARKASGIRDDESVQSLKEFQKSFKVNIINGCQVCT